MPYLPPQPIFRWETLREIGRYDLWYENPVPGAMHEVELTSGKTTIRVWRADDGRQYFCHGLTFGGKDAPGGPVSPFTGEAVETILQGHYQPVPEAEARPGDILVWRGLAPDTTPHSAILTDAVIAPGKDYLDEATRLQSKNGMQPEQNLSLGQLIRDYGESYNVFRGR
jgi:hypothetical protein